MAKQKIIMASCDWKSPQDLIDKLEDLLPQLGVYLYNVDTGSDGYQVVVASTPIGQVVADDIYNSTDFPDDLTEKEYQEFRDKYDVVE